MRKKILVYISIVAAFLLTIFVGFYIITKPVKNLYLSYGDDFSKIKLYSSDNKEVKLSTDKTNLVFYLSDVCNPCIQELSLISNLDRLSVFSNLEINLVWADNIPTSKLDKYDFKNVNNFSLKRKVQLTGITPNFYIVDNNKIIFESNDTDKIIKKILKEYEKVSIEDSVFQDLCKLYNYDKDNTGILIFTENCEGCNEWINYLNSDELKHDNYIKILDYQSAEFDNYIYDKYGIFKNIFGVEMYPAMITNDGEIVSDINLAILH